jgi:hypothetical protein
MISRVRVCVSLMVLGASLLAMPIARAQDDQDVSVAEAARRAREAKKAAAIKRGEPITDDTLQPASSTATAATTPGDAVGATTGDATATATGDTATATPDGDAKAASTKAAPAKAGKTPAEGEDAEKKARIEALKKQIEDKAKEVDLEQRALALANDTYYSRPDHADDPDGKKALDTMQSEIAQKQGELADLKDKLAAEGPEVEEKPAPAEAAPAPQPK